jgi:hypothetical protein
MREPTILKCTMPKTKARCEAGNGSFGLIRHRYAYKQSRQVARQDHATGFQFQTMDRVFWKRLLVDQLNSADGSWFVDTSIPAFGADVSRAHPSRRRAML